MPSSSSRRLAGAHRPALPALPPPELIDPKIGLKTGSSGNGRPVVRTAGTHALWSAWAGRRRGPVHDWNRQLPSRPPGNVAGALASSNTL